MLLFDLTIPGRPAPFATRLEAEWRQMIASLVRSSAVDPAALHLELRFRVGATTAYPLGPDLDNICQVVIGGVITDAGWFGGRRPGLPSFTATKEVADDVGVTVRIHSATPPDPPSGEMLLDRTYAGPLPRHARDEALAAWVEANMLRHRSPGELVAVTLNFVETVNIGEMATGPVKAVIDCLWPLLGGRPSAPDDGCVVALTVCKQQELRGGVAVRVQNARMV